MPAGAGGSFPAPGLVLLSYLGLITFSETFKSLPVTVVKPPVVATMFDLPDLLGTPSDMVAVMVRVFPVTLISMPMFPLIHACRI